VTKRIKNSGPRGRAVRAASPGARKIPPKLVADRLRAEEMASEGGAASPPALHALRSALLQGLRSEGGRPRLEGTERRQKIPMKEADWVRLEKIARSLQASGAKVTAGQVASHLLHQAIDRLPSDPAPYGSPSPPTTLRVSEVVTSTPRAAPVSSKSPCETTYLVGAGINRGVFGPERRQLPLARDFFQYVLDQPRFSHDHTRRKLQPLWEFIGRYWHRGEESLRQTSFDLEECFTLLELQRREADAARDVERLRSTLQLESVLSGLLGECFGDSDHLLFSSPELQKLGHLIYEQRAAVLTFNYDTLLESAIQHGSLPATAGHRAAPADWARDNYASSPWHQLLAYKVHFDELVVNVGLPAPQSGKEYYESFRSREAEHAPFLKLHGSMGWHFRSGHTLWGQPIEPQTPFSLRSRFQRSHPRFDFPAMDHANAEVLLPLIITPVLDKPVLAAPMFDRLWQEARGVLEHTKALIVMGYSFPPTDFHVRRVLREAFADHALENLCVVNPDASVASVARDLCNYRKPVTVCRDLGEYLG